MNSSLANWLEKLLSALCHKLLDPSLLPPFDMKHILRLLAVLTLFISGVGQLAAQSAFSGPYVLPPFWAMRPLRH